MACQCNSRTLFFKELASGGLPSWPRLTENPREPEVAELDRAVGGHEQVFRLDVSVDAEVEVAVTQGDQGLAHDVDGLLLRDSGMKVFS